MILGGINARQFRREGEGNMSSLMIKHARKPRSKEETITITTRLPESIYEKFKFYCEEFGFSLSEAMNLLISCEMDSLDREEQQAEKAEEQQEPEPNGKEIIEGLIKGTNKPEKPEKVYVGFYLSEDISNWIDSVKHGNKSEVVNEIIHQYLKDNGLLKEIKNDTEETEKNQVKEPEQTEIEFEEQEAEPPSEEEEQETENPYKIYNELEKIPQGEFVRSAYNMSVETTERLKKYSKERRIPLQDLVELAVINLLEQYEKK